jgi:hypothetical protein
MFFSLSSLLFPLVISCFGASDDGLPVGGGKKYHETFSAYYSADGKKGCLSVEADKVERGMIR